MLIKEVRLEEIIPLRHKILRTGKPISTCHFEEDKRKGTFHLGAFVLNNLVGIATFIPHTSTSNELINYQVRGMAVEKNQQGNGIGKEIILQAIAVLKKQKVNLLWCNAREGAKIFYQKMGFEIIGNSFEIPSVGIHYKMQKRL